MRPAAAGPEDAGVAVLFSGWLGVTIPHRGAVTRAALVEPLGAHVFVAGAFMPDDCGPAKSAAWRGNATACAEALWDRLALLRPFEAVSLEPMPTVKWLHGQLATNPHWPAIRKAFRADLLFLNLSIFSPVLGSRNANVLRELVMYERVYKLVRQAELRRQRKYDTLVFSRLEYQWLAPHPPLDAFASSEDIVWAPPPDANGMNDRHALLPRKAGPAYFQRWSSLLSPRIVRRFTLSELVALGPESFLRDSIIRGPEHDVRALVGQPPRFLIGEFPLPAHLACCSTSTRNPSSHRCWSKNCLVQPLLPPAFFELDENDAPPPRAALPFIRPVAHAGASIEVGGGRQQRGGRGRGGGVKGGEGEGSSFFSVALPRAPSLASIRALPAKTFRRLTRGKYEMEVRLAVLAWRWMHCSKWMEAYSGVSRDGGGWNGREVARWEAAPSGTYRQRASVENPGLGRIMQLVVPAADLGLHLETKHEINYVLPNRSFDAAARMPRQAEMFAACPLAYVPPMDKQRVDKQKVDGSNGAPVAASAASGQAAAGRGPFPGWCAQTSSPLPSLAAVASADGVQQPDRRKERKRMHLAKMNAKWASCKGSEEQATLYDCAHACVACAPCAGVSFSHDRRACTLLQAWCADDKATSSPPPPAALPAATASLPSLRSPDEQSGWDVISMSREQLGLILGLDAIRTLSALPSPRQGHCGGTDQGEEGDCTHGSKGSLPFGPNSKPVWGMVIADEAACVRFCAERCARCRYVSISAKGSDCSWYNKCAFDALELEPRWLFHKSYDLGSVKGKAKLKGQAERKAAKLGIGSQA